LIFFLNQFILKKKKNIKINDRNLILLLNFEPLLVQSIFYILTMNEKKKIIIIIYLFFSQVKLLNIFILKSFIKKNEI